MLFKKPLIYLQIHNGKITGKDINTGMTSSKICSGLNHPRVLMGDFKAVEQSFNEIIKELCSHSFISPAPIVLIHLLDEVEGGCTELEARAFKEAAFGAGGREVNVTDSSRTLSDQQILDSKYSKL